jgi:hypothetical protein
MVGERPENLPDRVVDRSMLHWTERDLQELPDAGTARVPGLARDENRLAGVAGRDEPGRTRPAFFNYAREPDFTGNEINNNALPEPSVPTRNYRLLEESNLNARFDDTIKIAAGWTDLDTVFGVGTAVSFSERGIFPEVLRLRGVAFRHPSDPWSADGDRQTYFTPRTFSIGPR